MLRVSQWFTENEDSFVGLTDVVIDSMIDNLPYFSSYDYFNHNNKNYMRIEADSTIYEWVFDEDCICIACDTYESIDFENEDFWDETLEEIENREWYRDRLQKIDGLLPVYFFLSLTLYRIKALK